MILSDGGGDIWVTMETGRNDCRGSGDGVVMTERGCT